MKRDQQNRTSKTARKDAQPTQTSDTVRQADSGSSTGLPPINARRLAWLAEWADGVRGRDHLLVFDTATNEYILKTSNELRGDVDRVICDVKTELETPARLRPDGVWFKAPGREPERIDEECDALFWTESAIEKFFFPYYHSQRLLTKDEMRALRRSYESKTVVAIAHIPPSVPKLKRGATVRVYHAVEGGPPDKTEITDFSAKF